MSILIRDLENAKQCFSMALVPRLPQVQEENGKKAQLHVEIFPNRKVSFSRMASANGNMKVHLNGFI